MCAVCLSILSPITGFLLLMLVVLGFGQELKGVRLSGGWVWHVGVSRGWAGPSLVVLCSGLGSFPFGPESPVPVPSFLVPPRCVSGLAVSQEPSRPAPQSPAEHLLLGIPAAPPPSPPSLLYQGEKTPKQPDKEPSERTLGNAIHHCQPLL